MKKFLLCLGLLFCPSLLMSDSGGVTCPAQGGTGKSATWTSGSILIANGSAAGCGQTGQITQDNANLYFDDTNFRIGVSCTTPMGSLDFGATGSSPSNFPTGYAISLPRATAAQIAVSTPNIAGMLIFNTTNKTICVSTGVAVNQWYELSSGTIAQPRGCDVSGF